MRFFHFYQFTPEELHRLCWLRAVEWIGWPGFLSQPLLPILYIFYPVPSVLASVFVAGLLWLPIRYRFVSLQLATVGAFWVKLKWVTIPLGVIVLLRQSRYVAALVAFATPWIAGFINLPGQVGIVEEEMWEIGTPLSIPEDGAAMYAGDNFRIHQ